MGITRVEAPLLWALRNQGEAKNHILSLGRPELYMSHGHLAAFRDNAGLDWSPQDLSDILAAPYADDFLARLGFEDIRALDYSDYQGAEYIHDLNEPIPAELEGITDFLFTPGTIEHIFDIRTVMRNITRLVRLGGTAALVTTQNGYGGHGFYQFSPEFFYRYFEANGFEDVRCYVVGTSHPPKWYFAEDPRQIRRRVEFITMEPTLILCVARKCAELETDVVPLQSDYADEAWTETRDAYRDRMSRILAPGRSLRGKLAKRLKASWDVTRRYGLGKGMPGLEGVSGFREVDPYRCARL